MLSEQALRPPAMSEDVATEYQQEASLMDRSDWFGVRCLFDCGSDSSGTLYEERVLVWQARDLDDAIRLAEAEAREYASDVGATYLDFAQAYAIADPVQSGAEVFSLMRESVLGQTDYLNSFFDTGSERAQHID